MGTITHVFRGFPELLVPLAVFLATVACGWLLRKIVFARLAFWARNTRTRIDDIVIASLKGPFIVWSLMLGMYFALESARLPEKIVHGVEKLLLVLGILSVALVLRAFVEKSVKVYASRFEGALPVTSLIRTTSSIIIFITAGLVILNCFGISITPILATLGVGGLAVALALQDTLANLFSGFHVTISKQIRVGDFIRLESGEEGYVVDINWRTTQIRMLPNNIVLVPNSKLSQSIVTNYCFPDKEMAVLVNLGVHYRSDLKKVRQVTCDVAREVMKEVPGGVADFEPFIRYGEFGSSGVNFTVIMRAREFVDQYLIKDQFIERLHARYAKEGITIPYPIRAVNYTQEKEA